MPADHTPMLGSEGDLPTLAGAGWLVAPACQAVFEALALGGYDARAVGGSVRNALIGEEIHDIDIATTAPPQETLRLARAAGLGAYETGLAHGTITVVSDHRAFEVTTLRRDVETFGRHAAVAFTTDWAQDARRRDFTINALYCDRHGTIFDPVGGYPDIVSRRVRFIDDPVSRIREDYLRILRFFRFHATYGTGTYDAAGLEACVAERDGLLQLSAERIRQEILRLIIAPGALQAAEIISRRGIAEIIVGRTGDAPLLSRVIAIEAALGRPADAMLRLAALSCETAEDASELASRLKLSNEQRAELEAAMFADPALSPTTDLTRAKACRFQLTRDAYERAYIMAWARSGAEATNEAWQSRFEAMSNWSVPKIPFRGADVVALGVAPGPDVGTVLQLFRDWWVGAGFPDDAELLRDKLLTIVRPFIG